MNQIDVTHSVPSMIAGEDVYREEYDSNSKKLYLQKRKTFAKTYNKHLQVFKTQINNAINHTEPIETEYFLQNVLDIMEDGLTTLQILETLRYMCKRDDITYIHSINVAIICNVFGKWLKMPEKEVNTLTLCGLFHDVGKLLLTDELVQKEGKFNQLEMEQMKQHPVLGFRFLQEKLSDIRIINAAYKHHERFDGTGYPQQLTRKYLDDYSMIVAIADVYDAMTSNRLYRSSLCPFYVIDIFETNGLYKYDPKFLLIFLEKVVSVYINSKVLLSNGEKGRIVVINKRSLARPVIRTTTGYIDLSKEDSLNIKQLLFS